MDQAKIKDLILDKLDVSVIQFCKEAKVSRTIIYDILNDKYTHTLNLLTIKKICKYCGVDYKDYL